MADPTLHALLRRTQAEHVLGVLRASGPQSRADLARATGISRTRLSELITALLDRGSIVVTDTARPGGGRGRPAERLALNPAAGQLLGIDFGHRRVQVVAVDAAHTVVASGARPYPEHTPWPQRADLALALVDELAAEGPLDPHAVDAIGAGIPGPFPSRRDEAPGDAADRAAVVRHALADRFDRPVLLDNNTRFAGLAEALWGSGAGVRDLVYVRVSDGIGGGLVVDGRLVSGAAGLSGEIGHVCVAPAGPPCRCGKRGCLETVASVPAILAACAAQGVPLADLDALATAVERDDPVVDRVLRDAGTALGHALGGLAMVLNPSEIVVGGEIAHRAPALLAQAAATVRWELLPVPGSVPAVRPAQLGDEDGALGAVAALFHRSALLDDYPGAPTQDGHVPLPRDESQPDNERSAS